MPRPRNRTPGRSGNDDAARSLSWQGKEDCWQTRERRGRHCQPDNNSHTSTRASTINKTKASRQTNKPITARASGTRTTVIARALYHKDATKGIDEEFPVNSKGHCEN